MTALPKLAPLIPCALGVLAFTASMVPEPNALAGVSLPNLWFEEPRSSAWDIIQGVLKISGAVLFAASIPLQAQRWGWSSLHLGVSGGGVALLSLLLLFFPGPAALASGLLFWSFIIGLTVMFHAWQASWPKPKGA